MDVEFKIRSVELLNELAEKRVQGLALRIPVHAVNEEMIDALEKLCKENTGGVSLQLYLKDEYEALQVEMLSRTYRIKINNPLIAEFRKYAEIGIVSDKGNVRWLTEEQPVERGEEFDEVGTNSPTFVLDTADLIN
jgi:hypothetical protein